VLGTVLSKAETKAPYDKIGKVYGPMSEHSECPAREAGLKNGGGETR